MRFWHRTVEVYRWIFQYLPKRFTLPFLFLAFVLLFWVWPGLIREREAGGFGLSSWIANALANTLLSRLPEYARSRVAVPFLHALVDVLLFAFLLVASYDGAAWLYSRVLRRRRPRPMKPRGQTARKDVPPPLDNDTFAPDRYGKIGIILAGGGAKGVYQAGAMKAIDEFLRQYDCLKKVSMVAGTSIGSWNALFWLADMVHAEPGSRSLHEQWWASVDVRRLLSFDPRYLPGLRNSFLLTEPWRENFDHLFGNSAALRALLPNPQEPGSEAPLHFYFTRSNVGLAHLEFTTNWTGQAQRNGRGYYKENRYTEAKNIGDIKQAVFASMDLPPLFPYEHIDCETFEDGGVVDNLPIVFGTQVEQCDLLFVLLLNASFEKEPDTASIFMRLYRVMDVRQGVLEKNALRLAYLYNEKYALGKALNTYALTPEHKRFLAATERKVRKSSVAPEKPLTVVAICPNPPLKVGTVDFWKTAEMPCAFKTIYDSTRVILQDFRFPKKEAFDDPTNRDTWIRIHLVSPQGAIMRVDDF